MTKTIEQKYRKLEEVEKVLIRPGRYIGQITPHTAPRYILGDDGRMKLVDLTWNPGLIKLFDEVISNSVDHSKTLEGKHLDTIKVEIDKDKGTLSVYDNGGIPVVIHKDHNEHLPTLLFGYLHSGSNFDDADDSDSTGQNGEGSTLANIFSTKFTVETCDGKSKFKQTWTDNMRTRSKPSIIEVEEPGFTKISFTPDYAHLKTELDDSCYAALVRRVYDVAGCNPKLKVYLNGKRINIASFKDYVGMFVTEFEFEDGGDWQVAIAKSDDGFKQVSFVNSTEVKNGGTHLDYVMDQITDKVREFLNKKHKVDVRPSEIRSHMMLFVNARIIRPRYDSQTKDNLITEPKDYKTSYKPSEKLIQRILKSHIIESVLQWVEAKAFAAQQAELKKLSKDLDKVNPRTLLKLNDAGLAGKEPDKCYLFIAEGKSAANAIMSGRNPRTMGTLELRGKPQNAYSVPLEKLLGLPMVKSKDKKPDKKPTKDKAEKTEFFNIMAGMGLEIGTKVESKNQLRYNHLVITSDADQDGGHIAGLMVSNLHMFWPELFKLGVVYRFFTPIVKVWLKGKVKEPVQFDTEAAYHAWMAVPENAAKVRYSKYFKGLGTSKAEDFIGYLADLENRLVQITIEDAEREGELIEMVFGKEEGATDKRKEWLADIFDGKVFDEEKEAAA